MGAKGTAQSILAALPSDARTLPLHERGMLTGIAAATSLFQLDSRDKCVSYGSTILTRNKLTDTL